VCLGAPCAAIAQQACRDIGYTSLDLGFDADSAEVKVLVQQQVPEIAQVCAFGVFR
jgi:S-adenosylmethionine synthetase